MSAPAASSRAQVRQGRRAMAQAMWLARERRWVRVRLLGWALIALWQGLSLLSEFVPLDLESRAIRIAGKLIGFVGLVLIAYGFERLVHLAHERAGVRRGTEDEGSEQSAPK